MKYEDQMEYKTSAYKVFRLIFPPYERNFPAKRWLFVLCLNLHLCTVCGYVGARLFDAGREQLADYFIGCVVTGALMILNDIYANGMWMIQNRGLLILLKVVLLGSFDQFEVYPKAALIGIVFLSGFVSHARRKFRHYSIIHKRVVEYIPEHTVRD